MDSNKTIKWFWGYVLGLIKIVAKAYWHFGVIALIALYYYVSGTLPNPSTKYPSSLTWLKDEQRPAPPPDRERSLTPDGHKFSGFSVPRGEDGRFLIGEKERMLVRHRIQEAVGQSPPVEKVTCIEGSGCDGLPVARAVTEITRAVNGAIFFVLYKTVAARKVPSGEGLSGSSVRAPPVWEPGQIDVIAKDMLKDFDDPVVLKSAKSIVFFGLPRMVDSVNVHEEFLLVETKVTYQPHNVMVKTYSVRGKVNLDEILKRIDKTGF